jgi:hypothetical protein
MVAIQGNRGWTVLVSPPPATPYDAMGQKPDTGNEGMACALSRSGIDGGTAGGDRLAIYWAVSAVHRGPMQHRALLQPVPRARTMPLIGALDHGAPPVPPIGPQPSIAATNKSLAQRNNTRTGGKATKKARNPALDVHGK